MNSEPTSRQNPEQVPEQIIVSFEATPNPQTQKFVVNKKISDQNYEFKKADLNAISPLARKLFGFPWVDAVFIGPNFVSVTKQEWVDWETLSEALASLIGEHIEEGQGVIVAPPAPKSQAASSQSPRAEDTRPSSASEHAANSNDSEEVQLIKKILDQEIRPAVAMDGGDVMFHKYEDKVLYLHMHGACNGCPSSTLTLKSGIANKLRESLPDLLDVEGV